MKWISERTLTSFRIIYSKFLNRDIKCDLKYYWTQKKANRVLGNGPRKDFSRTILLKKSLKFLSSNFFILTLSLTWRHFPRHNYKNIIVGGITWIAYSIQKSFMWISYTNVVHLLGSNALGVGIGRGDGDDTSAYV